jgi:preprotein translocase subunit SecE
MEESKSLVQRVSGWPVAIKEYTQELQLEMRRVTWPAWKQVRATTGVVIACVFVFAAYFWIVDFALGRSVGKVFETFSK